MDPNCNSDKYMTIKEAAKEWKIPRRAVRLLIARGYLNNDGEAQTEKGKETEPANKDDKTEIKKGKKIINANQEKPTEQELFEIGYDYPKHCFVFFTFVRRYFRNNKIKVLWVTALLSIAFLLLLHDLLFQSEIYSLYTLSLNVLLSTVLIIYCLVSDSFERKINSVSDAFPIYKDGTKNEDYWTLALNYYDWARCPLTKNTIDNLQTEGEEYGNTIRERPKYMFVAWSLFCVLWVAVIALLVYFSIFKTSIYLGWSGYYAIILFAVSMALLSQSFFNCFVYLFFFQKVTGFTNRETLKKYWYNKNMPSQTAGLVHLLEITNENAGIFMAISAIMSVSFFILLKLRISTNSMFEEISAVLLFICLVFFAILSSLVLNYGPRLMLRRLLKVWVTEERNEIEKAIFEEQKKLEKQTHVEERTQLEGQKKQEEEKKKQEEQREVEQRIMILNEKLKQLTKEKIDLNDNYLHFALTALSLLSPLFSLLN